MDGFEKNRRKQLRYKWVNVKEKCYIFSKKLKIKESAKKNNWKTGKNVEDNSKEECDLDPYFSNIIATTLVYLERTKGIKCRTQFMRVV